MKIQTPQKHTQVDSPQSQNDVVQENIVIVFYRNDYYDKPTDGDSIAPKYGDATWASWCAGTSTVCATASSWWHKNKKAPHYRPFVRSTGDKWIRLTSDK